eukprot:scaffold63023_cov55-Phaeocystis_antarctica.AAC.1
MSTAKAALVGSATKGVTLAHGGHVDRSGKSEQPPPQLRARRLRGGPAPRSRLAFGPRRAAGAAGVGA